MSDNAAVSTAIVLWRPPVSAAQRGEVLPPEYPAQTRTGWMCSLMSTEPGRIALASALARVAGEKMLDAERVRWGIPVSIKDTGCGVPIYSSYLKIIVRFGMKEDHPLSDEAIIRTIRGGIKSLLEKEKNLLSIAKTRGVHLRPFALAVRSVADKDKSTVGFKLLQEYGVMR